MFVPKIVFLTIFLAPVLYVKCVAVDMEHDFPNLLNFTVKSVVDPHKIIQSFGYPAETHKVITKDGYILILHRIPRGRKNTRPKSPVLIMHGISSSSADFVNLGPNTSLAYVLADEGYDVWLGNARGNSYSNRHIHLNPLLHPEKFYNFSWHEIGTIDLPTKIDYVLNVTNRDNLYYIGHSQGGTIFYVMTAVNPEYNKKVRLASLMAPAGFINLTTDPVLKFLSRYVDNIQAAAEFLGIYHLPSLNLIRSFMANLCKYGDYHALCNEILYIFGSGYTHQLNKSLFPRIFETTPSDASIRQFLHYFQEIKSGKFQQFDYGTHRNTKVYGTLNALEYNLSNVSAPVALYYAMNDRFIGIKDIQVIASILPQVVNNYVVPHKQFGHNDFLFAAHIKSLLYNEVLRVMEKY